MDQNGNKYRIANADLYHEKRSDWSINCASITWIPKEGCEPNWFHRKMQELVFGFQWRKNTK